MNRFNQILDISTESDTARVAQSLAFKIQKGDILALTGDLGAGKTFFCRELIHFLCGSDTVVTSPTFNLLQIYKARDFNIFHYDLYRLNTAEELYEIGFEEAISVDNVVLIEWPEIASVLLPSNTINMDFKLFSQADRKLNINTTKLNILPL